MQREYKTDAVIIGAGPVGLFAVFELGLLDMKAHLVDILDRPGGQCTELYPEKPIYDIPGYPTILAQELVDKLMEQIEPFNPTFHFEQMAYSIEKLDNGCWKLTTDKGTSIEAPVIIIAAGGGSFVPKKIPLKNADEFENSSLFYAVRDKKFFEGKNIVISGGGDSAIDWTLDLLGTANSVTLVHRRDEFRAAPDNVNKVKDYAKRNQIKFHVGQITELVGNDGLIKKVIIKEKDGENINVECDAVLAFYGLTMKLGPIADFGLNLDRNTILVDTEKFETSVEGIFAIGDINSYPGKLKLILSGFHESALMSQAAFKYVFPEKKLRFQYSTTSSNIHEKLGVV